MTKLIVAICSAYLKFKLQYINTARTFKHTNMTLYGGLTLG